jgi:hypothetical protein
MSPRQCRPAAWILLAPVLACAHSQENWVTPVSGADRPGVPYLRFAGSKVSGFTDTDGKSCQPIPASKVHRGVLGWTSTGDDAACTHDTQYEGLAPAILELRWAGEVPADGNYEIDTFKYTVKTRGEVVARGAWVGDAFAVAGLVIEVRSPHCALSWSTPIVTEASYGPWVRGREFHGYREIPALFLSGCRAGDALDVRMRLWANTNRGRIDVEAFGFEPWSDEDATRLFGLVQKAPGDVSRLKLQPCQKWVGDFCNEPALTSN